MMELAYEGPYAVQIFSDITGTQLRLAHQDGTSFTLPLATFLILFGQVLGDIGLTSNGSPG
jgi:hypothetical protein